MSEWKINPSGVREVLESAESARGELSKAMGPNSLEVITAGLTWCPALSAGIPEAVGRILQAHEENFRAIVNHVDSGIVGVTAAANTYLDAQLEMDATVRATRASAVESEMFRAAESGNFSFFEELASQAGEETP
ncbi:DUF6507 family protein [Arachnia propionica]|uniref:Uncharacterized protein n=1 Tax=Arachnia propionica TaxID=1750 RepID=A0A3P1WUT3_9ACTN|nr:DUF6507 family protein [Arachnia propionica]RRD49668.1 hypothetical protein EII35_07215 [Arachnia propionica]